MSGQRCTWCCTEPAVAVVSNDVWAYAVCASGLGPMLMHRVGAYDDALRVTGPDTLDDYWGGKRPLDIQRLRV